MPLTDVSLLLSKKNYHLLFSSVTSLKRTKNCYSHFYQLFGLVNTLLENSRKTEEKDLSIQRYAVIPLSPNNGLIGWVPNCDTLHQLIREYRDARKVCQSWSVVGVGVGVGACAYTCLYGVWLCWCIVFLGSCNWFGHICQLCQIILNQEHKYMLSFAPDYDHLPLIAKVEVFEYALQNTEGNDLARVCT